MSTLRNIAVKKIIILTNTTHKYIVGPLLNQPHILLYRRNVFYTLRYSNNDIVNVSFDN